MRARGSLSTTAMHTSAEPLAQATSRVTPGRFRLTGRETSLASSPSCQAGMHLVYSTYLGGSDKFTSSGAAGIALDNQDNAYVTGYTESHFFPTTADAFQRNFQGGDIDAFVTRLAEDGSSVWYSTYLGGGDLDLGSAIAVDRFTGDAFITGFTQSSDFPTTVGAFRTHSTGGGDGFVTKLGPNGRNLGYSTYLGPSFPSAIAIDDGIAVDPAPAAFVVGSTDSPDYPTTSGAYQASLRGTSGGFMTRLSPDGGALAYSTYLGGAKDDSAHGIALDPPAGIAYVVGSTSSDNFPTTADAYQRTNRGGPAGGGFGNEAFVTRFAMTPVAVTRLGRSGAVGTATLYGYVNAEGNQARYFYQYGTTAPLRLTNAEPLCGQRRFPFRVGGRERAQPGNGLSLPPGGEEYVRRRLRARADVHHDGGSARRVDRGGEHDQDGGGDADRNGKPAGVNDDVSLRVRDVDGVRPRDRQHRSRV